MFQHLQGARPAPAGPGAAVRSVERELLKKPPRIA